MKREIGARFSNAEYLKADFDFVEETGSITITTAEGTTEYEIGGGGGGGGTEAPIKMIDFILASEDNITAKYNGESYTYTMLDNDLANDNVVIGNYGGLYRAIGGANNGQGGYFCFAFIHGSYSGFIQKSLGTNPNAVISFSETSWNNRYDDENS